MSWEYLEKMNQIVLRKSNMTYFNSIKESGDDLKKYQDKTKTQDEIVLMLCRENKTFTASKIFSEFPTKAPLTSIRRSINTLLNNCNIVCTGEKTKGIYGRNETEYKLSTK